MIRFINKTLQRLLSVTLVACLCACTPTHNIKPLPSFVRTALEPGDRVVVTTHAGKSHEFVVTEIRKDAIVGDNILMSLEDIASLRKFAWERPDSPCGGDKPLGCSVPLLISLTSESHGHYQEPFYDACAQHDYCYRHGFASYGVDRKTCDEEFLIDMQSLCPKAASATVGKIFEVLDDTVGSRRVCLTVADDYYAAVRHYGEEKFLTSTSTYCEYNGPPAALKLSSQSGANNSTAKGKTAE